MEIDSESASEEKSAEAVSPTLFGDTSTESDYSSARERALLNDIELKLAEVVRVYYRVVVQTLWP